MICNDCKNESDIKDFFGNTKCYKCVFKDKINLIKSLNKKNQLSNICKICNSKLPKGRRTLCSKPCEIADRDLRQKKYWARQVKIDKLNWKRERLLF